MPWFDRLQTPEDITVHPVLGAINEIHRQALEGQKWWLDSGEALKITSSRLTGLIATSQDVHIASVVIPYVPRKMIVYPQLIVATNVERPYLPKAYTLVDLSRLAPSNERIHRPETLIPWWFDEDLPDMFDEYTFDGPDATLPGESVPVGGDIAELYLERWFPAPVKITMAETYLRLR